MIPTRVETSSYRSINTTEQRVQGIMSPFAWCLPMLDIPTGTRLNLYWTIDDNAMEYQRTRVAYIAIIDIMMMMMNQRGTQSQTLYMRFSSH